MPVATIHVVVVYSVNGADTATVEHAVSTRHVAARSNADELTASAGGTPQPPHASRNSMAAKPARPAGSRAWLLD